MPFGQFGQSQGSLILFFVCEVNIMSHFYREPPGKPDELPGAQFPHLVLFDMPER